MVIQKNINSKGYKEYLIRNKELMNNMIKCGNYAVGEMRFDPSFVEFTNRMSEEIYNFPLYNEIEDIITINAAKVQKRANAYYVNTLKANCFPNTDIPKKTFNCLGGYIYYNPETEGRIWHSVYAYDINSAYLSVLARGFYPAIEGTHYGPGIVQSNQIGYNLIGDTVLLAREGELADERFEKKYNEKLVKFAKECYKEICGYKAIGDKVKAAEYKLMVNSMIGVLRNHNVFFYVYIVSTCRYLMESLKDEDTLLCNTDGLISLRERDDLKIGTGLGEFKIEAEAVCCFHRGTNYALFKEDGAQIALKERGVLKAKQNIEDFIEGSRSTIEPDYKVIKDIIVENK